MEDRRKSERAEIATRASCRVPATPISATIGDISMTGCQVQIDHSEHMLQKGATVLIALTDDFTAAGQVVWRKGSACGVKFNQPIDRRMLNDFCQSAAKSRSEKCRQQGSGIRTFPILSSFADGYGEDPIKAGTGKATRPSKSSG